ncbi:hypothetical protein [Herbiconiux daphne]|uniref:Uncharacterized protein n=1 Tax=Herbiconiux daphne TaxID=2970914 RepID=A0ABT2H9W6_9MICO|nr:hypothetical protein [Herbiconiux daphne]MCS5736674.1 hypothetical protein [Herbiconiux daphne]
MTMLDQLTKKQFKICEQQQQLKEKKDFSKQSSSQKLKLNQLIQQIQVQHYTTKSPVKLKTSSYYLMTTNMEQTTLLSFFTQQLQD